MDEGLRLCVAQHLRRLILSHRHGFDTAAVYLGKVGRVVDGKGDHHRDQLVARHRHIPKVIRAVGHSQQLQHQRRTAKDGDEKTGNAGDKPVLAHAQQGNDHAQGERKQQRQGENGAGFGKSLAHLHDHCQ